MDHATTLQSFIPFFASLKMLFSFIIAALLQQKQEEYWVPPISLDQPNAFLTFRIQNPFILNQIKKIQSDFIKKDRDFMKYLQTLSSLHITLDVYNITETNVQNASIAMNWIQKRLCPLQGKLFANFSNIHDFSSSVLFGGLDEETSQIVTMIQKLSTGEFKHVGIHSLNQFQFHPHMTIVILKENEEKLKELLKEIEPKESLNGTEFITEITLAHTHLRRDRPFYDIILSRSLEKCKI